MLLFSSNYTLPPEGTNFVNAPPLRSTLQILWTCISVLILCTWSVVHLNVPPQEKVQSRMERFCRDLSRIASQVRWMLFNMLAPEWIFVKALSDLLTVRGLRRDFKEQADKDHVTWKDIHTHYAEMGGFAISFNGTAEPQIDADRDTTGIDPIETTQQNVAALAETKYNFSKNFDPSFWEEQLRKIAPDNRIGYIERVGQSLAKASADKQEWHIDTYNSNLVAKLMEGSWEDVCGPDPQVQADNFINIMVLTANLWIPSAAQLLRIRQLGLIDSLPDVDEDDLNDRSKSNSIIKAITIIQIFWFDLQVLVRLGTGIAITQLEVMVFAFTIFSVTSYVLAWNKPRGTTYTITLKAKKYPVHGDDMRDIASVGPILMFKERRRTIWPENHQQARGSPVFRFDLGRVSVVVGVVVASIFGALHCIAWYSSFPSALEQRMWQASAIITTGTPILGSASMFYILRLQSSARSNIYGIASYAAWLIEPICLILFFAARLFTLVEVFRSLGFQPPEAFISTWTGNLPHIT